MELSGFGVCWLELESAVGLAQRARCVAATEQRDREVEVVILLVRIGCGGALEERCAVFALAAQRDSLIVQHFRQRQTRGEEGKGLLGACVVGRVEARQTEVEVGLKRKTIVDWNFGKRCGCSGVIAG